MTILEVQNVKKIYTTRFGGNQVQALTDVNFTVEEGEYVAIMGESGSGKTTLLNILAALDKPTGGQVLLAGKDTVRIPDGQMAAFRRDNLGFVFQEYNLLDTLTLEENTALPLTIQGLGPEKISLRVRKIADKLQIGDVLGKFPFQTSGGQKQRISIARVFLKNPPILILDEATSPLDNESEHLVNQSLERLAQGRTTVTIAHRLTTIQNADRILVLSDGKIMEEGSHEELLEKQGMYYQLYMSVQDKTSEDLPEGEVR